MEEEPEGTARRLTAVMRQGDRVMPLELFFDLVFVLALTQCTALMVANPTWEGIAQGILVLGLLWWAWTGYAGLTNVIDPEEGSVRLVLLAAMAALLIAALTLPGAFSGKALEFALAYGVVRAAQIALLILASREDPALRRSVAGLSVSTAISVGLLIAGSLLGGGGQAALWALALALDASEPYVFGVDDWKLVPAHFAERHGLVIIIALGESVVTLGVGTDVGLPFSVAVAAVLGIVVIFELWWVYFDVVAIANTWRLVRAPEGHEQNDLARDVYAYFHFPLVAGIMLAAVGLHDVLAHTEDPLRTVPAFALLGGVAIYLLGHVAVRLRGAHTLNRQRLALALVLFALIPVAREVPALATLGAVTALLGAMIAYETRRYGPGRSQARQAFAAEGATADFSPR